MTIKPNHRYLATLSTSDGSFTIQLLPRLAPRAVNNFVFLSRHAYYRHNLFHRIIAGFIIQTGDPTGTGMGGPGYYVKDDPIKSGYALGTVAMANAGKNTNGSQFFIVVGPNVSRTLPKHYVAFGRVVRGINVVAKIANTPVTSSPSGELSQPLTDVYLNNVTIKELP